jgi:hypothetical protein
MSQNTKVPWFSPAFFRLLLTSLADSFGDVPSAFRMRYEWVWCLVMADDDDDDDDDDKDHISQHFQFGGSPFAPRL